MRHFASDNYAPIHPKVLEAIVAANQEHDIPYGHDSVTARLGDKVKELFGASATALPLYGGTGANTVALAAITPKWGSVIVATTGHTNTDEAGAPERIGGVKLLHLQPENGKLTPANLDTLQYDLGDVHAAHPSAVSIAQSTEMGTVYTPEEIRAIAEWAHARGMFLHLDGARIFSAAAALGVSLREITADAGVDIFSIGATKNGGMVAEILVVLNPQIRGTDFIQKYQAQLPSKTRFISTQALALLEDDLGIQIADHSNSMARFLRDQLQALIDSGDLKNVEITQPVDANALFVKLLPAHAAKLNETYRFYEWVSAEHIYRWMLAWDHTEQDVLDFVNFIVATQE
ncbi:MAG: threonine aldolase [Microbacteriaceae bacterium]|nr:threonine aldolase [Microbacteriaceae bacterium]